MKAEIHIPDKGFTHAGKFHSDDVFATALLKMLNPQIQIERGFEVPQDYDGIVYDIGRGAFDHHQEDKEIRENGVPYAAFGLLWRAYGTAFLPQEEAASFDENFIQPLDLSDNTGCENMLADIISKFNPGWDSDDSQEEGFWKAVDMAGQILERQFESVKGALRANVVVDRAMEASDGTILVLPVYAPWKKRVIGTGYQFVVYPSNRGGYSVQGVPKSKEDHSLVCDFPQEWWGKSAEQLVELSGVETFRFCHATGFMAAAQTQEDAMKIAQIALDENSSVND